MGYLAAGFVPGADRPAETSQIAFGQSDSWRDADFLKVGTQAVVKGVELLRAADGRVTVIKNAFGRKKLRDHIAAGLVPDLFKPAHDQVFVQVESGDGLGSG